MSIDKYFFTTVVIIIMVSYNKSSDISVIKDLSK